MITEQTDWIVEESLLKQLANGNHWMISEVDSMRCWRYPAAQISLSPGTISMIAQELLNYRKQIREQEVK